MTWALKGESEFARGEEGKPFFSRVGITKRWPAGKAHCPNSCRLTTEQPLSSSSPPLSHIRYVSQKGREHQAQEFGPYLEGAGRLESSEHGHSGKELAICWD